HDRPCEALRLRCLESGALRKHVAESSRAAEMGFRSALIALAATLALADTAWASPDAKQGPEHFDRFDFSIHGETYGELFRRALVPGPSGALVHTDTVAPMFQYAILRARDIDTSFCEDCIDVELTAWGRVWLGDRGSESPLDGDVQTANVRYRQGPLAVRL